jgi:hypothetical protein
MKKKTIINLPKTLTVSFWSFIACMVIVCSFITSCNSKADLPVPASKDASSLASRKLVSSTVFTVSPSGNYNDDSYNIQTALDNAVATGPGSTVQLTAGTFYLKERIEVAGFDGFFKGAGKDQTLVTTHDKIVFNIPSHQIPSLIKFRNGNIGMSDMTITVTDPEPCTIDNQDQSLPSVIVITGNDVNPGSEGQTAKFNFNNLKFVGGDGNVFGYNYNIIYFIYASWESDNSAIYPLTGGYKITNCEFQQGFCCLFTQYTGGPCLIGGDATSGNRFIEAEVGAATWDISSSYCKISSNFFERIHWDALQPYQGVIPDPSTLPLTKFIISDNNFNLSSYEPGTFAFTNAIELVDYGIFASTSNKIKMDAVISNNKIHINDIGYSGLLGECCSSTIVTNNIISGSATAGIVAGIFDQPQASHWLLKYNDVTDVNAEVAPVWLGPGTSYFVVFGDKSNILDEGTDNVLTGVIKVNGSPLGPEIQEARQKKADIMNLLIHHRLK